MPVREAFCWGTCRTDCRRWTATYRRVDVMAARRVGVCAFNTFPVRLFLENMAQNVLSVTEGQV